MSDLIPAKAKDILKDEPYRMHWIFQELLQEDFIKDKFKGRTSATEIQEFFDHFSGLEKQYAHQDAISVNRKADLENWIHKTEQEINTHGGVKKKIFHLILAGDDPILDDLIEDIFEEYFEYLGRIQRDLPEVDNIGKDEYFRASVKRSIENISMGVAYAVKFSIWKKELTALAPEDYPEEMEFVTSRFKNVAQKYFLLYELGIIDLIEQKYSSMTASKKALLLAYITDSKNSKSFENIFTNLSNSQHDHYPFNEKNETQIINILTKLGIQKNTNPFKIKRDKK